MTKVTPNFYEVCKLMLKGGASVKEVSEYMKISANVVYDIKNADSYDDYKQKIAEYAIRRRKAQKPEDDKRPEAPVADDKKPGGTLSSNYQINRIYELMKSQNELLTLISNKLAYIVESLS